MFHIITIDEEKAPYTINAKSKYKKSNALVHSKVHDPCEC